MEDVVAIINEFVQAVPVIRQFPARIMSSINEPASTLILEYDAASLAEYEKTLGDELGSPQFAQLWARFAQLIESMRIEFYSVIGRTASELHYQQPSLERCKSA
jgi:hypothetical protein